MQQFLLFIFMRITYMHIWVYMFFVTLHNVKYKSD